MSCALAFISISHADTVGLGPFVWLAFHQGPPLNPKLLLFYNRPSRTRSTQRSHGFSTRPSSTSTHETCTRQAISIRFYTLPDLVSLNTRLVVGIIVLRREKATCIDERPFPFPPQASGHTSHRTGGAGRLLRVRAFLLPLGIPTVIQIQSTCRFPKHSVTNLEIGGIIGGQKYL